MGKKMYIGVDGKARKVKKAYIGVGNKARKVKKMYMGIDGKARLIFSGEASVSYFGTAENLQVGRYYLSSTTIGNYALFAGGHVAGNSNASGYVDAYDVSLTHTIVSPLSRAKKTLGATHVGNYALFAGGNDGNTAYFDAVEVYDTSLTKGINKYMSTYRTGMGATHVGNYALFAGGKYDYYNPPIATVDAFDASLTRKAAEAMGLSRMQLTGLNIGNLAMFAAGMGNAYVKNIDIYNASLTHSYSELPLPGSDLHGASTDDYALFGGGYVVEDGSTAAKISTNIFTYNKSGTRGATLSLSKARSAAAAAVNGMVLFGGGGDGHVYNIVDSVNESLTVQTLSRGLSEANANGAAASVGNYILFAGGSVGTGAYVDVYKVE